MDSLELIWDVGTAYDLFVSLEVLHEPSRYGLRGSWAAGVRSRLPAEDREFLQSIMKGKLWAIPWLVKLPGPKDGASVLHAMAEIPAAERLDEIAGCHEETEAIEILRDVRVRGTWDERDKEQLRDIYQHLYRKEGKKKKIQDKDLIEELEIWSNAEAYGERYLGALKAYYEVFFAEEEGRIQPVLETAVEEAKSLADTLSLADLLEELSQGLRFDYEGIEKMRQLTLIPSFWTTPLTLFTPISGQERWIFLFGARPPDASLVPGEVVPELLYQTLKALADPTRLRILRYLSEAPSTPARLARRLRLRSPTVLHHLDALRLARLVQVTLSYEGRRYEARREAIKTACDMLENFLAKK